MLGAESVGPPGKRYFRLRAWGEQSSAILWLEKEQLYELAVTIKQLLKTSMHESGHEGMPDSVDTATDYDFKVQRLAIGHDEATGNYMLLANVEPDSESVAIWVIPDQLDRLADIAFEVCASGRVRCTLCGAPLNEGEGHICARTNGHHPLDS